MFGLINLDKPPGMTSRKAIDHIQRRVQRTKIGHTGTLDPLAEGVLIVTVGPATRLTSRIQAWNKSYQATFLLGCSSDTEDVEGKVIRMDDRPIPDLSELQSAIPSFIGKISQQPPSFSALKIKGRRAYELARRGESVELAAREVTIHEIQIQRYAYPELELGVVCGSGTYIRSLGRDLARAVGTEAVMCALRRTAVGHLTRKSAVTLDALSRESIQHHLLSPLEAVRDLPQVRVTQQQLLEISHGRPIGLPSETAGEVAAVSPDGDLAALLWDQGDRQYRPRHNFSAANTGSS